MPDRRRRLCAWCNVALVCLLAPVLSFAGDEKPAEDTPQVEFERDIKPLLAKHCFECHGADKQESGFRLDRKKTALDGGDNGKAIIPGRSGDSPLIARVSDVDSDGVMPPEGERLTAQEVGLLRAWVDQGLDWPQSDSNTEDRPDHWAYQPLVRPEEPVVKSTIWIENPVDAFVLAKLEAAGISPAPAADRHTLIRRMSLDLLGLLPAPEEVRAFVDDESPDAYEALVDRMLQSPHFGERWGRHWLDMARYADSDGYEKDRPRPNAWRWRDWVIDAVNADMPFDQFTIEQLAGDLLENPTEMQKLATAFHRQTLTNTEGGTDQEQFRVEAIFDRVETTGTVWLGLTIGCARCHSHKYDQISQREYYQLFAFYNNGDEVNSDVRISDQAVAKYEQKLAEYDQKTANLKQQLATARKNLPAKVVEWEPQIQAKIQTERDMPLTSHDIEVVEIKSTDKGQFEKQDDGSWLVTGTPGDKATYTLVAKLPAQQVTAMRLEVLSDDQLPSNGPGRAKNGNFVLSQFRLRAAKENNFKEVKETAWRGATSDYAQQKFPPANALTTDKRSGWAVGGQTGQNHEIVFVPQQPLDANATPLVKIELDQQYGGQHLIGRFRLTAATGTPVDPSLPNSVRNILATPTDKRTPEQLQQLTDFYAKLDPVTGPLIKQLDKLKKSKPKYPSMSIRAIAERTKDRRETHMLRRGDFLQPIDSVSPDTLATLPKIAARNPERGGDRLDLAQWLVSEDNPLTPRVLANHIWSRFFGNGLVRTNNDFGVRGEPPTHPQLLDWLGSEYRRLGWSRKSLIKTIVMSNTYRQSSHIRPDLQERDPLNRLLHRQNRVRVEAEIVRDISLLAGGLLSNKVGGPSVYPPMPKDVAALSYANNFKWKTSDGEDRYRRGMYTFFKRTAPHPNLTVFDCPDSNTTCIQRRTSNTPLQALTTLNNVVYVEAAQAFARRMLSETELTDEERLAEAFWISLSRPPSDYEASQFHELLNAGRQWFSDNPTDAEQLTFDEKLDGVSSTDAAAWTATLRMLINVDSFVTRE